MRSSAIFTSLSLLFGAFTGVQAGFNPSSKKNIALYWGQNSYGQGSGDLAQQRLSYYCSNSDVDTILLAFLIRFNGDGGQPELNFANQGNPCTTFSGTSLLNCPEIASDIATCQNTYGKTILLSVGGGTYSEGGFTSSSAATSMADQIWAMFGPVQSGSSALRPFGTSVIDGFDFDFEATVTNMVPFANQLRSHMDAATSKKFYLTAAPQCPYPDAADNEMLNGAVSFDAVLVQFYNNYCGVNSYVQGSSTQNNFNFATWDNWAKTVSKNKSVKVLLGAPADTGAGAGYISASQLANVISYSSQYSSFGGVMLWDASQAWANSGFIDGVWSALSSLSKRARSMRWGVRAD